MGMIMKAPATSQSEESSKVDEKFDLNYDFSDDEIIGVNADVYQEKGDSPFEKPGSSSRVSKEEEGIHKVP